MSQRTRIVAIDGGGIRGMIPALVLAELEKRAGMPVDDLFDLAAGASTGGILACGLTIPGSRRPPPLRRQRAHRPLRAARAPHIFDRSLLKRITSLEGIIDERYPTHAAARRSSSATSARRACARP